MSGSWNGRKRLERRKEKRTDPKKGTNENQRTSAQVAGAWWFIRVETRVEGMLRQESHHSPTFS